MNITIEIHYKAASRGYNRGNFPLRGRVPEKVALEFWKQINKELSYRAVLEKVLANGENDITELVLGLEKEEALKSFYDAEDLPF
jgi:hypothetical protein